MVTLEIEPRTALGKKAKTLSQAGRLPAVFYGKKEPSTAISLSTREFEKVWREAGESGVIILTGAGGEREALIHRVDLDPVRDTPRHVDFYVIEKGQKVRVAIPIEFTGVAPAVKERGGMLVKVIHDLDVEAEPHHLPQEIVVDVSSLVDFESQISAKDIRLPAGVTLVTPADEVVVLASEAKEDEIDTDAPAPDLSAIEVEKKGKVETVAESGSAT